MTPEKWESVGSDRRREVIGTLKCPRERMGFVVFDHRRKRC